MFWIFLMLISAMLFGFNQIVNKKILKKTQPLDLLILGLLIQFIILLPLISRVNFDISFQTLLFTAISSAFAGTGSFLIHQTFKKCPLSSVAPMLNFSPILLIILSYFLFKEALTIFQLSGVFLTILGGYIITLKDPKKFTHPFTSIQKKYYLMILGTLIAWTIAPSFAKLSMREIDPFSFTFLFIFFLSLFGIISAISAKRYKRIIKLGKEQPKLILISSLLVLLSDLILMFVIATPGIFISLIFPIRRTSTLFAVYFGGRIFHEKKLKTKILATSLMMIGVFIIALA